MQEINTARYMVVERSTYTEIIGAQSVDINTGQVTIKRRKDYQTEETVVINYPEGIVVIKRSPYGR